MRLGWYDNSIFIWVVYRVDKALKAGPRKEHASVTLYNHDPSQVLSGLKAIRVDVLTITHHVHFCVLCSPLTDRSAASITCSAHILLPFSQVFKRKLTLVFYTGADLK